MIRRSILYRTGLDAIRVSGAARFLAPALRGLGAIFMLHHVLPADRAKCWFGPNAGLEVTPEFLDAVIGHVKRAGYRLASLDEAVEVVKQGREERPLAVFTLDDGYRDNYLHAWPVFRAHHCPFTIFVAPAITDGISELWWKTLEHVIAWNDVVDPGSLLPGEVVRLNSRRDRRAAWRRLYRALRGLDPTARLAPYAHSRPLTVSTAVFCAAALPWIGTRSAPSRETRCAASAPIRCIISPWPDSIRVRPSRRPSRHATASPPRSAGSPRPSPIPMAMRPPVVLAISA